MSDYKLLPCPFCGGTPTIIRSRGNNRFFARCFSCETLFGYSYTSGAQYKLKRDCVSAWNTRAQLSRRKESAK